VDVRTDKETAGERNIGRRHIKQTSKQTKTLLECRSEVELESGLGETCCRCSG